ncbi:amino acid ABC transporter permease/ATP-binding protein [Amycolatopsis jejuensis]|uniref:amino acid ABC transporter permease/ATP-binding protein n=1 Tax=Amycolatopsis jejuensis TaxID=330084 RepID=UPI00068C8AD2|nr:amino acid ABC transporter permease/ATP-binding protein [Amycolatopsis jejuensis]
MVNDILGYATLPYFLEGILVALRIAGATLVLSLVLGLALALAHNGKIRFLRWLVGGYLWVIRGTPVLLQLIFWYNALPAIGLRLGGELTAIWSLTIAFAAFVCELSRGGLMAVKQGQLDAGAALGMSPATVFRLIRGPQALRVVLPGLCTLATYLVKETSLASVIAVDELTLRAQQEVSRTFQFVAVFGGAAAIYVAVNTVIAFVQRALEKKLDYTRRKPARDLPSAPGEQPPVAEAKRLLDEVILSEAPPGKPNVVSARGLVKQFGDHVVLNGVDLDVPHGEVVCVIGPSGSGKTTLLRCLNNLEPVTSGVVEVNGVELGTRTDRSGARTVITSERRRVRDRARARVGMVFQQFNLFENLTVGKNLVAAPIRTQKRDPDEVRRMADRLLSAVGLAGYGNAYPHQLSGGQQQRVAICRALAAQPTVLLFDEPTSALDPEKVGEVLQIMQELGELGMTMIVSTHEMSFARRCATRVVFMDGGNIVESGTPQQVLENPQEPRTRQFLRTVLGDGVLAVAAAPAEGDEK